MEASMFPPEALDKFDKKCLPKTVIVIFILLQKKCQSMTKGEYLEDVGVALLDVVDDSEDKVLSQIL